MESSEADLIWYKEQAKIISQHRLYPAFAEHDQRVKAKRKCITRKRLREDAVLRDEAQELRKARLREDILEEAYMAHKELRLQKFLLRSRVMAEGNGRTNANANAPTPTPTPTPTRKVDDGDNANANAPTPTRKVRALDTSKPAVAATVTVPGGATGALAGAEDAAGEEALRVNTLRNYRAMLGKQEYLASVAAEEEARWPLLSASERKTLKKRVGPAPQHPAPRMGRMHKPTPRDAKWKEDCRAFAAKEAETYKTMLLESAALRPDDPAGHC